MPRVILIRRETMVEIPDKEIDACEVAALTGRFIILRKETCGGTQEIVFGRSSGVEVGRDEDDFYQIPDEDLAALTTDGGRAEIEARRRLRDLIARLGEERALGNAVQGSYGRGAYAERSQGAPSFASDPANGFLRIRAGTVSREDVLLEVPPAVSHRIGEAVGCDIELQLQVSARRGAGSFVPSAPYTVFETAGFTIALSENPACAGDDALRISGRVELAADDSRAHDA